MAFDPDAYLAQTKPSTAPGFDPDAYLAQQRQDAMPTGRTWAQVGREAVSNIPESGMQMLKGLYTAVTSPRKTLEELGEVLTGAYARFIPQEWMARPDKAQEFIEKANAFGGVYKDRYGSVEALKNTIATDPVGFAADVSTLAGAGAVTAPGKTGQVLGAASRYTDPTRLITAPAGAVLEKAMLQPAERFAVGPKANLLLESVEGRPQEVINALRRQPEIVPGAMPTAGEAAASIGVRSGETPITRFSALQESAEKVLPSEYFGRRQAQNLARENYLRQVGGTEADLKLAVNQRAAEAKLLYGKAGPQIVAEDSVLRNLRERPSMQKAFDHAKRLAAEEGATFGSLPGMGPAQYTAADMHYVKMALDDLTKSPADFGISKVEAGLAGKTKAEFIKWLESKVPDYGTARSSFSARSKPINQMEVGQYLENKLTSALRGEEKLSPQAFATAVQDAPLTIKRATGVARFEKLSDVLTPDQIKIVEDIRSDLARQARYKEQAAAARPAGPTAQKAGSELLVEAVGGVTTPTLLSRIATVANAISRRLAGKIDKKLSIEIATELLNPDSAALAIELAAARAGRVEAVGEAARATGRAVKRGAAPAAVVTNALAEAENRNQLRMQ